MYQSTRGGIIDGDPRYGMFPAGAVAQMANDALHVDVTGLENNTRFTEREWGGGGERGGRRRTRPPQVWLEATRRIRAGEEILVTYGLNYWLNRREKRVPLTRPVRHWLRPHAIAKTLVERAIGRSCYLVDQVDEAGNVKWYEVSIDCEEGGHDHHRNTLLGVDLRIGEVVGSGHGARSTSL